MIKWMGLSINAPWAWFIAAGLKRIETRGWYTGYRGPLVIHVGKSRAYLPLRGTGCYSIWDTHTCADHLIAKTGMQVDQSLRLDKVRPYGLPLGALIAVAELVDCRKIGDWKPGMTLGGGALGFNLLKLTEQELNLGNYEPGRYGWVLDDVRAFPTPIPYRGRQGLFDVPDDVLAQCGLGGAELTSRRNTLLAEVAKLEARDATTD